MDLLPNVAFTTSGSLVDSVDKKVLVLLRDGRKLVGILRSYDQFANLVLQDAVERIHVQLEYASVPAGVLIVRGENVVLVGEIDLDREDDPSPITQVPASAAFRDKAAQLDTARGDRARILARTLRTHGFIPETAPGDAY